MKKTAKVLSVVLAVVMMLSVLPFAALAETASDNEARVAGWKENHQLFLDTILDNDNYASYKYVDLNNKALKASGDALTAFALYDNAWKNYANHSVSIDDAEKILLMLIEKADYDFDDGYVDEIVKVLDTASDVNDFIQKVNKYANIEFFQSAGWSTTFQVIGTASKIAHAYQNYRDEFIAEYAKVLSVQMANAYYIDMLQYIVDNSASSNLRAAAAKLIEDMNRTMEDVLGQIALQAADDAATIGVEYLATLALNSNAYTAVAKKVYDIGTTVANFLWNAGSLYTYIDTLLLSFDFQKDIANWTAAALAGDDADKAVKAVELMLSARTISEDALRDYKIADSKGAIGKIKSELYGAVYEDIEINLAAIDMIHDLMFAEDIASFRKFVRGIYVYCPVDVQFLNADGTAAYTIVDGAEVDVANEYGVFASVYSEYDQDFLKIAFLYDTKEVRLIGTANGKVTLVMDALKDDGTVEDWSFTELALYRGRMITFNTNYSGTPYFVTSDGQGATYFDDTFVSPTKPKPTAGDVANAVTNVGKNEAKGFAAMIKAFFENLLNAIKNLFKFKK